MKLDLRSVSSGYGKATIIQDINLECEAGSIISLIGPNGSGKSTLLKTIMGLCDLQEGIVCLSDEGQKQEKYAERSAHEKESVETNRRFAQKIAYLPQSHQGGSISVERMVLHGRFPYLSGWPRRYRKEDIKACNHAMEQAGILDLKDRNLSELSGGQRQKVYIAMALAGESEIFLFDEPTTYLDIKYQLELFEMMKQLKEQKKTVIGVLHDLNSAMQVSDRIILLDKGTIVSDGTPRQIIASGRVEKVFGVSFASLRDESGKEHYIFHI